MDNETLLEPPAPVPPEVPPTEELATEASPAPESRTGGWKGWAAGAAATAVIVVVGAFFVGRSSSDSPGSPSDAVASADGTGTAGNFIAGPRGRGTAGTITAIKGGTLTVESTMPAASSSSASTVSVITGADTRFTETVAGSLTDLAVGDTVMAVGETTDGILTARSIVETDGTDTGGPVFIGGLPNGAAPPDGFMPPDGAPPPDGAIGGAGGAAPDGAVTRAVRPVRGEVTKVDGSTVTVRADDGTETTVAAGTATVSITHTIRLTDLAVGDMVRVTGMAEGSTVAATSVQKGDLPIDGPGQFRTANPPTGD